MLDLAAMMPLRHLLSFNLAVLLTAPLLFGTSAPNRSIELVNNQPFAIRLPVRLRGVADTNATYPGQQVGSDVLLVANVAAGQHAMVSSPTAAAPASRCRITPDADGARISFGDTDVGRLAWDILVAPAGGAPTKSGEEGASTRRDFSAQFTPLPLHFERTATGPVCDIWSARATKDGLRLAVELVAYEDGFLDINAELLNEAAPKDTGVYAAVIARWEQSAVADRTLCADNRISGLAAKAWSAFRTGEGRHLYTQRGVDWVLTRLQSGATAAWMHDFAPSFTLLDRGTRNTFHQPRYYTGNVPQLGEEVQTVGDRLYSITEIARPNIRSYRDRVAENTLPPRGEPLPFSSRIALQRQAIDPHRVDELFVAYTGYNAQRRTERGVELSFGTASIRFGTAYFPYSTLGENFDRVKLPGMDRDAFWPLAADTVLRWREFADDIRRDIRLIRAMGFQCVRLHHLELLATIPTEVREEYLQFLFGELKHVGLKALIDVYAEPASIAEFVRRHVDVIEGVELENEILIWGIPADRPEQWKATYAAIKQVAPQVSVHLTGYNNTGMFLRLEKLGVPFDRIGLHSYIDSLDAIPTGRGYALALGSLGSKLGKPPVITEFNWRGLARMTPDDRAKVYPAIFDTVLATRAVPELHQFQFNETMAPNPRVGRGNILRHYELVHLSRRLKPEAFELVKLIQKYAAPEDWLRRLEVPPVELTFDTGGAGTAPMTVTNRSATPAQLHLVVETGSDLTAALSGSPDITLAPGQSAHIPIKLQVRSASPGFYHAFIRFESAGQPVRYAWIQAARPGVPHYEATAATTVPTTAEANAAIAQALSRPTTVLFGDDAPVLEVETAIAIAETLESATGRVVDALPASTQTAADSSRTLIVVGTAKTNPLIENATAGTEVAKGTVTADPNGRIIITGSSAETVEHAGMDFLLRYWRFAKDSAARRVGLSDRALPRGVDPTKLP